MQKLSNCSLVQALHSSHKLAPFSAFFQPSRPPLTYPTFLAHPLLYCITQFCSDFLLFDATHCGPLVFFHFLHVVRTCTPRLQSHPIAEPLVRQDPPRAFSPSISVARWCTLSVFVLPLVRAQCLAQIDWLTCSISSTSTPSATGIGTSLHYGAGMH